MPAVMFLCTGNYYRSRLAELYFNHLADQNQQAKPTQEQWQATSRGLRITGSNVGPLSIHTQQWLEQQGINPAQPHRKPIPVQEADFWAAQHIVAVKEAEHRSIVEEKFPHWADRVEFWHIHDLDAVLPEAAIPELIARVEELFKRLTKS